MVGFDAVASKTGTGSTVSWSHTIGSGSNRLLIVGVSFDNTLLDHFVSSITFGAANLTKLIARGAGSAGAKVEIWYLIAPATGIDTITVTFDAAVNSSCGSTSYSGVDGGSPFMDAKAANGSDTAPTVTVTTGDLTGMVIDCLCVDQTGLIAVSVTVDVSQTQRYKNGSGTPTDITGAGSTEVPSAGTTPMDWVLGSSREWAIAAAALRPFLAVDNGC